jgi:hypothetical protein
MCPQCQSKSIEEHPEKAGLYVCADCGTPLVRMKRERMAGGVEYYYVKVGGSGMKVYRSGDDN